MCEVAHSRRTAGRIFRATACAHLPGRVAALIRAFPATLRLSLSPYGAADAALP
jgi:hypothetical protein